MAPAIPLRWCAQDPEATAQKFLEPPDTNHLMWTFLDVPLETDFEITPHNIAPYAIALLDGIAQREAAGVTAKWISLVDGTVKII